MERVRERNTNVEGTQTMTARDQVLTHVRGALGRTAKAPVPDPPSVRLHLPNPVDRVAQFTSALEALAGKVTVAPNLSAAKIAIDAIVAGRSFVDRYERRACVTAEFGINRADYALADTGSLVFLSESGESRLISLLPPRHIAIVAREKILSGLDELFTLVPQPAAKSSSMVIVTGPSRTADIEMRLVRGVHGPGEIHVIIVEVVTPSQSNASEET
jgi:L-lactate dehydrogenase complex protein LldG